MAEGSTLALEFHDKFRRNHGSPPIELDARLCREAEAYGKSVLDGSASLTGGDQGGKNVYRIQSCLTVTDRDAVREAVTSWYGNADEYSWKNPVRSSVMAKQFCQVVWKSSTKLGVAVVRNESSGNKMIVVVAVYSPAADLSENMNFVENVFPLK